MKRDELLGSGKGKLDFDKVPMEEQDVRSRDEGPAEEEQGVRSRDEGAVEEEEELSEPLELSALAELDLSESDLSHSESESQAHTESDQSHSESEVQAHTDGVPVNIMGDLESLFSDIATPEPVVPEQVSLS